MENTSAGGKVLIVEDDPMSRDMITRRLQARGFIVETACDGSECLARLGVDNGSSSKLPLPPFDLVLLDVQMPGLSGLVVLERVRRHFSRDVLPIILLTALSETEDVVRGLEAGASDYVTKPVVLPILLARMNVSLCAAQSVRLLVEAERQRVVIAALGEACHQLSQPMQASMMTLESLIRAPSTDPAMITQDLKEVLQWTQQVAGVIHRLQEVGTLRALPFTERMQVLEEGRSHGEGERPR